MILDDMTAQAKSLLRATRAATLATLDPAGAPFASLVNLATAPGGAPLLLVSALSAHTGHLRADPRLSLLLSPGGKGDPLAHPRLTVSGTAGFLDRASPEGAAARRRFLARHPKSALYANFPDFTFVEVEVGSVHLNGGFARAAALAPADLLTGLIGAEALIEAEEDALTHVNADHPEAVRLYARGLGGADGPWRMTGLDPEGADLALGDATLRLSFPERLTGPGALRRVLAALAEAARERGSSPSDEG